VLGTRDSEINWTEPTPSPLRAYNLVDKTDKSINHCNTVSHGALISKAKLLGCQESSEKQ
jgi:hypothetical protein